MWITTIGIGDLMAHFCITEALSIAQAIVVIPLDFMRLPLISKIGLLAHGEALKSPILIAVGVIFVVILVSLKGEKQLQ